jgi:predicted O-linked N-acetylglucosamine transferase (SPINDLY family)/nucleoside-diphosphate-sugar epimerase
MTLRILVTGASGFIGRQTIDPLLKQGHEIHAIGATPIDGRARWYRCDLLDATPRRRLIAAVRPDAVLHCAWVTRHGQFWEAPENLDWVAATLALARESLDAGARRFLVTGSCAELDWTDAPRRPWQEDDARNPATLYGIAKDSTHRLLARHLARAGAGLVWARLFHLYGPHDAPGRLVPALISALREGRRFELTSGPAVRDFMHVADAGWALAHLLTSDVTGPVNVASGQPVTIATLAAHLGRLSGRSELLIDAPRPSAEPAIMAADITRLRAAGFTPSITLDAGLAALWSTRDAPAVPVETLYDRAANLYRAERLDEARAAAESVLERNPNHAAALNLLGVLHRRRAAFARAQHYLERAAAHDPDKETAWINLGNVHLDQEDADSAIAAYSKALAVAPARADTWRLLGNALGRAGRDKDAIDALDRAVAARVPLALRDRSRAHYAAGRIDAALSDLDKAQSETPGDADVALIRAQMLRLSGRAAEGVAALRALLAAAPDNPDIHMALADAYLADEQREQANDHYKRAASLKPGDEQILGKYCWCLLNSRYGNEAAHIAESVRIARELVSRETLHPACAHAVQSALLRVADLDGLARFDRVFPDRARLLDYWVRRNVVGALHAQLGRVSSPEDRLVLVECHRRWGAAYEAKTEPVRLPPRTRRDKIRIGIVSSDLRNHPVSYFALPIFDHYDRDRFDLFAYSFHPGEADDIQRDIESKITAFRRLPNLPEKDIANAIAADGLDILFELGGSTHLNRLEVMAHQPAPVQVSWLGYPHSSGLSRIGHILVDPYLKPPDPRMLLEKPFEMPDSWVSLGRIGFIDHPIRPGTPEEHHRRLTFGTMNNPYKYSPDTIALWSRVLRAVPSARFLFVRPEAGVIAFREGMARLFERHGVAPDRLAFAPIRGRHMPFYNEIDIALDTLPQTGGTTTCEALWMGVPTISLIGPAFFERLSYSNLVNAGLGDLAVATPEAYVAAAVALAEDRARRLHLRATARETIRSAPLGDTRRWVRAFEALTIKTLDQQS